MQNNYIFNIKNPSKFRRVFCLALILISFGSYAQANLKFKDAKKNFGFVKQGQVVKIVFDFTNTGKDPLIISDAKAECSCTTVDYPNKPIAPNQTGTITVTFDTKSARDRQDRVVEIHSNAVNEIEKIRFKGVVLK